MLAATTVEHSDAFWNPIQQSGLYGYNYDSLADISQSVHAIVRGRIAALRVGDFMPYEGEAVPIPILIATVTIDEVLKGELESRTGTTIEVSLDPPWPEWESQLLPSLPAHDHLFFLMNDAQQRAELGYPARADNERYLYWRPNGDQAVLRIIDGKVAVIEPEPGRYPESLHGTPVEQVTDTIEAALDAPS